MMIGCPSNIIHIRGLLEKADAISAYEFMRDDAEWINDFPEGTWGEKSGFMWMSAKHDWPIFEILHKAEIELLNKAIFKYGRHLQSLHGITMRKWVSGEYQEQHSDTESIDENGALNPFPENISSGEIPLFISDYSAYIYLNDDFDGGELFFPDHRITIKPQAGSAVVFPSGNMYMHGVKKVNSGLRYTVGMYFSAPKTYGLFDRSFIDKYPMIIGEKSEF